MVNANCNAGDGGALQQHHHGCLATPSRNWQPVCRLCRVGKGNLLRSTGRQNAGSATETQREDSGAGTSHGSAPSCNTYIPWRHEFFRTVTGAFRADSKPCDTRRGNALFAPARSLSDTASSLFQPGKYSDRNTCCAKRPEGDSGCDRPFY